MCIFPNKRVKEYFQLCEKLIDFSNLSWWIIDLEDDPNIFYCNETMCRTFSLDYTINRHSVLKTCPIAGDYNNNIAIRSSEKAKKVFDEYHQLREGKLDEYSNCFPYYDAKAGETIYFSSRARALLKDELGASTLLFGIIERESVSDELYNQVKTDSLTGLNNRREFDYQIEFLINLAKREKRHISLIMCDVDHFKQYNDLLGHYAGDECLVQIAGSISNICIRSSDIVCRYGGEEFCIILYGDDKEETYSLAESIRHEIYIAAIPHPAFNNAPVTVSIGYYSIIPDSKTTPRTLIENADAALYKAKRNGKNSCVSFDGE